MSFSYKTFVVGKVRVIIRRYITKETLKTQLAILFILLMIFFSQKLIRILSNAVDGDIPANLVMPLLLLGVSDMAELILPLSLFLGILITLGRFYSNSEMVAMYACGVKKAIIYQVVILLSIITSVFTISNIVWFGPWSDIQQKQLVEHAKLNPSLAGLLAGQFQRMPQGDSVIYIGNVKNNTIENVFIATTNRSKSQRPTIILANKGQILSDESNNQIIILDNANRYEGTSNIKDFRISNFNHYQGIIKTKELKESDYKKANDVDQISLSELRQLNTPKAQAEYFWRLTLIISAPLMAFLVIPLSAANPRQGRLARILPAILLYLIYFLLESSIKANAAKGRLDPAFWFFLVNGSYFMLAVIFNIWDSLPMRKLRYKFLPTRFAS